MQNTCVAALIYLLSTTFSFCATEMTEEEKKTFKSTIEWSVNIMEDCIIDSDFDRAIKVCETTIERWESLELNERQKEQVKALREIEGRCFRYRDRKNLKDAHYQEYLVEKIADDGKWIKFVNDLEMREYRVGQRYRDGVIKMIENGSVAIEVPYMRQVYILSYKPR